MNIYQATLEFLAAQDVVSEWHELSQLLTERSAQQPLHWRLPMTICEAVGGQVEQVIPAIATIACLHTSIVLVDDMLDSDPEGLHLQWGEGTIANYAQALLSLAHHAVMSVPNNQRLDRDLFHQVSRTGMMTALGQALDAKGIDDEADYWRIANAKSAPFFGLSFYLGAQMGGANGETCTKLQQLGELYGELIQIHDDLGDSMTVPASPDWQQNHATLPILFAQTVTHPERERFLQLRKVIPDEAALVEAQDILIRCGAISYTLDHLLRRYNQAEALLPSLNFAHPDRMHQLFAKLIAPVKELLQLAGETNPDVALQILIQESALPTAG